MEVSTCSETSALDHYSRLVYAYPRPPPRLVGHQAPSNDPTKTKVTFTSSVRTLTRMQKYVFFPLIRLQTQLPKSNIRASFQLGNTHLAIIFLPHLLP
jgi:hypothetical protein